MTVEQNPLQAPLQAMVVGANHKSSTMMLRDRLFVEEARVAQLLGGLVQGGVKQAMVISTCDRVDIYAITDAPDAARAVMLEALAAEAQLEASDLEGQTYTLIGAKAVEHVFRVAASLDSLMVGEPQILGQLKAAHRQAVDGGTVGAELESLLQAAYGAAKRVRSETRIGEGPVSMSTSAVQIARDLFGEARRCRALLIGAGDMGELIAHDMQDAGLGHLSVLHPRPARAEAIGRELSAHVAPFEELSRLLIDSDIVLTALGSRRFTLDKAMVAAALKARRSRPIFIVDAAVPGDVEPAVEELDDAFVYGLGDLERVALKGRAGREQEAAQANLVLDEEVEVFLNALAERGAVPVLIRMRSLFEETRKQALIDAGGDAEKATRLLASRLLHEPSQALRKAALEGADMDALAKLLEDLFPENDRGDA